MNEEPTLNDKLTLLAEKCPRLGLRLEIDEYWCINLEVRSDVLLDSTDGKALFKDRVVRELIERGKWPVWHPNRIEVFQKDCYDDDKCQFGYEPVVKCNEWDISNEVERYATALYQEVKG